MSGSLNLLEKDFEAAVVSKIAALGVAGVEVTGAWQPAEAGTVKATEAADAVAACAVAVAPRSYDTASVPTCALAVSVALLVRMECAPDGAKVAEIVAPLFALFQTWQNNFGQMSDDLALAGEFEPQWFRLDGGDGPTPDRQKRVWSVSQSFTVYGTAV